MKAILTAAIMVLVAACGHSQAAPAGADASPPSGQMMFAILQAKGTANPWDFNSVSIVDMNGQIRATTTFTPMTTPQVGCMGAVLPDSAHVAAGKVFFSDASGEVRSLAPDGTVALVTTFPVTSGQQMLSFAVSPDGKTAVAGIFTAPTNAFSCDGSKTDATYSFDAYRAVAGSSPQLVYHQSWTQAPDVMEFTGWDSIGPTGTYPSVWASQGGGPGSTLGVKARIDPTTLKATPLIDPASCLVWHSNASGAFVCTLPAQSAQTSFSVREANAQQVWTFTTAGENAGELPYISPDAQHVAVQATRELVYAQDGTHSTLADGFFGGGWLDSNTVIGWTDATNDSPSGTVSYVRLDAPGTVVTLGLSGSFVGPILG